MATYVIEVYIKLPSGKSSRYDMHPHQHLYELCSLVAADEGVKTQQVRLKYQGKTLDTAKTIFAYGVRVETILRAEILIPQDLHLAVVLADGAAMEVTITNLQPVSSLFEAVAHKTEMCISNLQIKVEGRVLTSSSVALIDAGIAQGTQIFATEKYVPTVLPVIEQVSEEIREKVLTSFDARGRSVEVAFSFDTTGSMYKYLNQVRQKLRDCCTRLIQDIPRIRISIIAHGDYCDSTSSYTVRFTDFTADVQKLTDFAMNVAKTTGGDVPECYELALKTAHQLDWSEDSAKAFIVIGDCHPHPPSYTDQNINWREELALLTGMDIKVYGVQAGRCGNSKHFYKELADVSGGCYLNLGHFDIITDMFLAVCYKEAGEDLLCHFEQELMGAGMMTDEKSQMFTQLKQKSHKEESITAKNEPMKRKSTAWWHHSLDKDKPKYIYNKETDKWRTAARVLTIRYTDPTSTTTLGSEPVFPTRSTRRRHMRCSIM